eukprot:9482891-Pyramimonas_sp.AAC.1
MWHAGAPEWTSSSARRGASVSATGRRRNPKWSKAEEKAFERLVNTYGQGMWKQIMVAGRDEGVICPNRSEVDLKDKWRNMTKKKNRAPRRSAEGFCDNVVS